MLDTCKMTALPVQILKIIHLKAIKNLIFIKLHEKNFIKKFQMELLSKNTWFFGAEKSYNYILYFHMGHMSWHKSECKRKFCFDIAIVIIRWFGKFC